MNNKFICFFFIFFEPKQKEKMSEDLWIWTGEDNDYVSEDEDDMYVESHFARKDNDKIDLTFSYNSKNKSIWISVAIGESGLLCVKAFEADFPVVAAKDLAKCSFVRDEVEPLMECVAAFADHGLHEDPWKTEVCGVCGAEEEDLEDIFDHFRENHFGVTKSALKV